jgi:hypothetical protein
MNLGFLNVRELRSSQIDWWLKVDPELPYPVVEPETEDVAVEEGGGGHTKVCLVFSRCLVLG